MKKLCLLLTCVFVLYIFCINAFAIEGASATLSCDGTVLRGNSLLVTVSVGELQGVSALAVEPVFDNNAFSLADGEWKLSGALADFDANEGNGVLAFSSATTVSGEILCFELAVSEDAILGAQTINCNVVVVYDGGERETVSSAPVTVELDCNHSYDREGLICSLCGDEREVDLITGDVNFDGNVNNLDAVFILQQDSNIIQLSEKALIVADVNDDDKIDNIDASFVLRYDAGLIDSFE